MTATKSITYVICPEWHVLSDHLHGPCDELITPPRSPAVCENDQGTEKSALSSKVGARRERKNSKLTGLRRSMSKLGLFVPTGPPSISAIWGICVNIWNVSLGKWKSCCVHHNTVHILTAPVVDFHCLLINRLMRSLCCVFEPPFHNLNQVTDFTKFGMNVTAPQILISHNK
jgi:hypothetical protein